MADHIDIQELRKAYNQELRKVIKTSRKMFISLSLMAKDIRNPFNAPLLKEKQEKLLNWAENALFEFDKQLSKNAINIYFVEEEEQQSEICVETDYAKLFRQPINKPPEYSSKEIKEIKNKLIQRLKERDIKGDFNFTEEDNKEFVENANLALSAFFQCESEEEKTQS
jgi:transcriptional regulator of heat shock response